MTIRNALLGGRSAGLATALGVSTGLAIWALAHLPMKLPKGRYELVKGPVTLPADNAAFAWELGTYRFARYVKKGRVPAELQAIVPQFPLLPVVPIIE